MWLCAEGTFARELGLGGGKQASFASRVIQEAGCAAGTSHQRSAMAPVATEAAGDTEGVVFFTSKHFGGKAL